MSIAVEAQLVLAALATWRLAHLLAEEDGPGNAVVRLRAWLGNSALGRAMDCFYCLSLWISVPMALLVVRDLISFLLAWLGCAGAACLLQRATAPRDRHDPGDEP